MKNNKEVGIYEIPIEVRKLIKEETLPEFARLFNGNSR